MINELLFLFHILCMGASLLIGLHIGSYALTALIGLNVVLANIFVTKQITLFGLNATSADIFTIGTVLGINLLQEYFGRTIAKKAISISFLLMIFYTIMSQFQIWYAPSLCDTMNEHFCSLLSSAPRILSASLAAYCISQYSEYLLYGFLKNYWNNKFLILRNWISTSICQLLDTILFSFLGLYGIVDNISHIIFISYTIKMIILFLSTPAIVLSKKIRIFSGTQS